MPSSSHNERETPFLIALISGGVAGTCVDVALFPIDTLKTRLQSPHGFLKSGGFRGIYNGVGAAFVGSAPGASLFFSVYETLKAQINNHSSISQLDPAVGHVLAASAGEAAACLIRVPTEVIKQNMQIISHQESQVMNKKTMVETFHMILAQKESSWTSQWFGGLYRGYGITLMREVPFAFIQFPLYERFKLYWSNHLNRSDLNDIKIHQYKEERPLSSAQSAICGSISGGIAAAATTPLDVIKTRLMIGKDAHGVIYNGAMDTFRRVVRDEGWRKLLSGIEPRVFWISLGGFVFFGAYEECRSFLI